MLEACTCTVTGTGSPIAARSAFPINPVALGSPVVPRRSSVNGGQSTCWALAKERTEIRQRHSAIILHPMAHALRLKLLCKQLICYLIVKSRKPHPSQGEEGLITLQRVGWGTRTAILSEQRGYIIGCWHPLNTLWCNKYWHSVWIFGNLIIAKGISLVSMTSVLLHSSFSDFTVFIKQLINSYSGGRKYEYNSDHKLQCMTQLFVWQCGLLMFITTQFQQPLCYKHWYNLLPRQHVASISLLLWCCLGKLYNSYIHPWGVVVLHIGVERSMHHAGSVHELTEKHGFP